MTLAIHLAFYTAASFLAWLVISQFIHIELPLAMAVGLLSLVIEVVLDVLAGVLA
jgi:hypothetical protein